MSFLYVLLALAVLLVMITVHEFGHYIAGKIFGFKINEFSIGFGPALYKRKRKDGEIFAIRALPLGGYCAFEGEDEEGKDKPDSFNAQPAWKRIIVLLSGVAFNFLFGILTAVIYLFVTGYATPKITSVINSTEYSGSGLYQNDIVVAVDGKTIENYRSFDSLVSKYKEGDTFTITVERDGQLVDIVSSKQKYQNHYVIYNIPAFTNKIYNDNGLVDAYEFANIVARYSVSEQGDSVGTGVGLESLFANFYKDEALQNAYTIDDIKALIKDSTIYYVNSANSATMGITYTYQAEKYTFWESITKAWPFCINLCGMILSALGGLFTGATAVKDMGGTITAVSQIAEISKMGIDYFLLLLPLLAMNLALFNILPIPSLDGARALFVFIELIFRKPVPRKIEGWIHTVGLFLLLGLVIFFDVYHFAVASKLLL